MLGDGGKGFKNDVTIFGTNPQRARGVVGFQVQPREVLISEDMRDKSFLLSPMSAEGRITVGSLCSTTLLGQFASEGTKIDSCTARKK